jgi:hypothetical protein
MAEITGPPQNSSDPYANYGNIDPEQLVPAEPTDPLSGHVSPDYFSSQSDMINLITSTLGLGLELAIANATQELIAHGDERPAAEIYREAAEAITLHATRIVEALQAPQVSGGLSSVEEPVNQDAQEFREASQQIQHSFTQIPDAGREQVNRNLEEIHQAFNAAMQQIAEFRDRL